MTKPQKACAHVGCHTLVPFDVRYCEKHTKQAGRTKMLAHKRDDKFFEFYQSKRWRETSRSFRISNPLCRQCQRDREAWEAGGRIGREPVIKVATSVDHITALKDGGNPWDWSNLQGLCARHHNEKTLRENEGRKQFRHPTIKRGAGTSVCQ